LVNARREEAQELAHRRFELARHVAPQPAGADVGGHHPLPRADLEDIQDHLPLAEAIQEHRHRRQIEGVRGEPHQVRSDPLQLGQDHPHRLRPRRDVQLDELLDRQAVDQVVADRVQVVRPIGHDQGLGVGLGLHVLLDPGVEEADVRDAAHHSLAVELQQETQHAVRAGMLGPHVEQHGLARQGPLGDQVLQFVESDFERLLRHE
jgi:hypothetical protein